MKIFSMQLQATHLLIRDFNPHGIFSLVEFRFHAQAGVGSSIANQLNDGLESPKRLSSPVTGDVAEEAVFDLIPLAGAPEF